MSQLMSIGLVFGIFGILFVIPYQYTKGIATMRYGSRLGKDVLISLIPGVNVIYAEHLYFGKFSGVFYTTLVFIGSIILRVIGIFAFEHGSVGAFVTVILLLLALTANCCARMINVWRILMDADCVYGAALVVYTFIFPIGELYIGGQLPKTINRNIKEEDTFSGSDI